MSRLNLFARLGALLLWLLVGLGLAYAVLQLRRDAAVPAAARTLPTRVVAAGDWSRVMGQPLSPAAAPGVRPRPVSSVAQRYRLVGIVSGSRRAALMSLDGQLPRVWRPGDALEEGYVVQHIGLRELVAVRRGDAAATFRLELPELPAAATGVPGEATLPSAASQSVPAPAAVTMAPGMLSLPPAAPAPDGVEPGPRRLDAGGGLPASPQDTDSAVAAEPVEPPAQ